MKFVGGEALIFTKFFKGECNFSQSSQVKRKGKFSTSRGVGGVGGGGPDIKNYYNSPLDSRRQTLAGIFNIKHSTLFI